MTLDEIIAIHNGLDPQTRPRFFTSHWRKLVRVTYHEAVELPSGQTLVLYEEQLPSGRTLLSILRVAGNGVEVETLARGADIVQVAEKWEELYETAPASAPERATEEGAARL